MKRNVIIKENYDAMSAAAADIICDVIRENPKAAIVLATGHSPLGAYRELVRRVKAGIIDVSQVTWIKLDEWLGLTSDNEATCEYFIQKEIIRPLAVPEKQYIHFNAEATDPGAEAERIEKMLEELAEIDLVLLGIGMNGHLGLNEPAEYLTGPAHTIELDAKTKTHEMLTHTNCPVTRGITLGIGDIFRGRKVLLLADGSEKEKGLKYFLNEEVTANVPVSFLKLHPDCVSIVNALSFNKSALGI